MEYRLIKIDELSESNFFYCFCGNREDSEIIETNKYLHIYDFMGKMTMDQISGKSVIYKFIKAYIYVLNNKDDIENLLSYLDVIESKLVITCYDDFDMAPILYMVINKLIDNKCTCVLESDLIKENGKRFMKRLYGSLYFKFIYKKFYNNGIY